MVVYLPDYWFSRCASLYDENNHKEETAAKGVSDSYLKFSFIFLLFLCGSLGSFTLADRYAGFSLVLSSPLIMYVFNGYFGDHSDLDLKTLNHETIIFRHAAFVTACIVLGFMYIRSGNFPTPTLYDFDFTGNGSLQVSFSK